MVRNLFARFVSVAATERGATAIEYALIAALIAVAAIVGMGLVGNDVSATFNNVANAL